MRTRGLAHILVLCCLCIATVTTAFAGENPRDLAGKTIDKMLSFEGRNYPYKIYLPAGYDGVRKFPVIVSLHGLGGNIENYAGVGLRISAENYVVVTPQAPYPHGPGFSWLSRGENQGLDLSEKIIFAALDDAVTGYTGDKDHVFLTGLSQGGHMTYVIGMRNYRCFKGLIPCAGAYSFYKNLIGDNLEKAKDTPVLQTVGRQDCRGDEGLYPLNLKANKALREMGYDARLLTYPIPHTLCAPQLRDINDWIQLQMVERRTTADILKDLEKAEGFERVLLVLALAMNDDERAINFVEKLVKDGRAGDELCAAATGLILNKSDEKADALLKALLNNEEAQVRKSTVHAMGMRAVEGMAGPLLKIMCDTSEQKAVREEAFRALQKFAEADDNDAMTRWVVIMVVQVDDGGQAAAAGMKVGDVILEYDGKKIKSQRQLLDAIKAAARKRQVKMAVEREGGKIEFQLKGGKLGIRITSELHLPEK